jgi:LmbE family N-acetylglucosaminyl deacetylase
MRFIKHMLLLFTALTFVMGVYLIRWTLAEYERRQGLYWYDVEQSYDYAFDADRTTRVSVAIDAKGFDWPAAAVPCGTAFLRVSLTTSLSGRWFEPEVAVSTPEVDAFTQHFERAAAGSRYLNVSPVCQAGTGGGSRVEIAARHAKISPQLGELLLFPDLELAGTSLLVVAPHPDDAEIAAFSLYRDNESVIVTTTVGDYSNPSYERFVDKPEEVTSLIGHLRAWDSISVPMLGGVPPDRSLILGYLGGTLEEMHAEPSREAGLDRGGTEALLRYRALNPSRQLPDGATATWHSLVSDLTHVIDVFRPAFIATPHPVLDGSIDHRLTTLALLEALEAIQGGQARLLLYNNHHLHSEYWPYGPADSWMTLPPWFADAKPDSFGTLYSHPLDRDAQVSKLFALDAMHDLRAPPRAQIGDPTLRMLRWFRGTVQEMWSDPHRYYSYFRRGPRPNELFFVIEPESRDALREAAHEALRR